MGPLFVCLTQKGHVGLNRDTVQYRNRFSGFSGSCWVLTVDLSFTKILVSTHWSLGLCSLTSKLLLPVAGDLAALGLDGLLAVSARARSLPGAESTVSFVGYAHAPLPLPTVRLALLLSCRTKHTPPSQISSQLRQVQFKWQQVNMFLRAWLCLQVCKVVSEYLLLKWNTMSWIQWFYIANMYL